VSLAEVLVGRRPMRTLARIILLVAISYLAFGFLFLPVRGEGISMGATFVDGQLGFVSTTAYWRTPPRRGDIVGIRMAGRRVMYVKRIVGLPGERLELVNGMVLVDGVHLLEPYLKGGSGWNMAAIQLGPDDFFVVGDNRTMPIELHDLGVAHRDRIVGKVLF
jgi:signal peptidase I